MFRASMMKPAIRLAAALVLSGLLSACGQGTNDTPGEYRDDGYLGMTQTNPNLQTNPTERSHYEDTQIARRTLLAIEGVRQAQMFSNGPHVFVYLRLDDDLTEA